MKLLTVGSIILLLMAYNLSANDFKNNNQTNTVFEN